MRPFETLDEVVTDEGGRLTLHRRGGDYFIHLDGEQLMSTRVHGSESALAELALAELPPARRPRVLIGGLGLGFTLRAALERLPSAAEVVVAEVFEQVVEWNRTYLAHLGAVLEDRRVRVVAEDVAAVLKGEQARGGRFQAVLLDVDNGPSAWCLEANERLYDDRGLALIRNALVTDGILGIWSAFADRAFEKRLRRQAFVVRAETIRGRGRKGPRHVIFLARRHG